MPAPTIDDLPPAPTMSDSKKVFNQKATAFVAALSPLVAQINSFGAYLDEYSPPGDGLVYENYIWTPSEGNFSGNLRISKIVNSLGHGWGFISGLLSATAIGSGAGSPATILTLPTDYGVVAETSVRAAIPMSGTGTLATADDGDMIIRLTTSRNLQTLNINGSGDILINLMFQVAPTIS
jgi:hypothetical protein